MTDDDDDYHEDNDNNNYSIIIILQCLVYLTIIVFYYCFFSIIMLLYYGRRALSLITPRLRYVARSIYVCNNITVQPNYRPINGKKMSYIVCIFDELVT